MKVITAIAKDRNLRRKCLFVILILIGVRVLADIPTPGVNSGYFRSVIESNEALGLLNVMTGGGLSSLSIAALGITPYITASIIIQLLGAVSPRLHEFQRSPDKTDKQAVRRINVITGICLGAAEAVAMSIGFGRQGMLSSYTWHSVLLTSLIWTAGAALLIFSGELITDKLIGNGISLILAVNIIASFPSDIRTITEAAVSGRDMTMAVTRAAAAYAFLLVMLVFIIWVNTTVREIPVTQSRKASGGSAFQKAQAGSIPIRLCPGSVIPVVFAASLIAVPSFIASFVSSGGPGWLNFFNSSYWFKTSHPVYSLGAIIYIALIFAFTFFYIDVEMSPYEIADNLKKTGAVIPGIRPGKPTGDYLDRRVKLVAFVGAIALSIIAVVPYIVGGLFGFSNLSILGTSMIIAVGVVIEMKDTVTSAARSGVYLRNMGRGGIFNVW